MRPGDWNLVCESIGKPEMENFLNSGSKLVRRFAAHIEANPQEIDRRHFSEEDAFQMIGRIRHCAERMQRENDSVIVAVEYFESGLELAFRLSEKHDWEEATIIAFISVRYLLYHLQMRNNNVHLADSLLGADTEFVKLMTVSVEELPAKLMEVAFAYFDLVNLYRDLALT